MSRDILEHLVEEPGSQDTFEGLASWWLLKRDLARYEPTLRRAADFLVARGFLTARAGTDGREHYRLDPSRLDEIREFLTATAGADAEEIST